MNIYPILTLYVVDGKMVLSVCRLCGGLCSCRSRLKLGRVTSGQRVVEVNEGWLVRAVGYAEYELTYGRLLLRETVAVVDWVDEASCVLQRYERCNGLAWQRDTAHPHV